jgi:hypothetical protein
LSSLADEKRVSSLLLSTAARDPLFDGSRPLAAMFTWLSPSSSLAARRQYSGFPDPRCHERRLGDHERLLTTPDVHRHDVIVIEARLDQREGYADLEGW